MDLSGVGDIALAFLRSANPNSLLRRIIRDHHLHALEVMVRRLGDGRVALPSEQIKTDRNWLDVLFLSCYQLVCLELMRVLVSWPTTSDMITNVLLEVR